MKYCKNCDQHVEPEGRINWLIFIILFIFLVVPSFFYLGYCLALKDKTCPQCGACNWGDGDHDHDDEE